jgi:hypothetical protein
VTIMAVRSTGGYELWHDRLYGVSRWHRVEDEALTDMQTGQDCEDEVDHALELGDAEFVELAQQQAYSPHESRNIG